ncbi:Flp family type IVb pilin [uncultured Sphingomonas sp.]|jgi:pilus assembly protein Flp/PilA|uniref:Flp family type IVb pilin n=1 Tax=Sphingomonas sp. 179-A 4D3 NHS TaxID=3374291 RepID=UPI0025F88137|nr:Flp family type IVb pilin [uncultured Sphingomonas sp.]
MRRPPSSPERSLIRALLHFVRDTRGATAVEYGLILAVIVLALMASLIGVADVTTNMWSDISSKVVAAR